MTGEEVLTTSPMLFAHRGRDGRLVASDVRGSSRFRLTGARGAEIITAFLEPRSVASAIEDGFELDELRQAHEAGILIADDEREPLSLWERNGWSRPAHLLFSQMDLSYRESEEALDDPAAARSERRAAVEEYQGGGDQPAVGWLADGDPLDLPEPSTVVPSLSAMTTRRSVRGFSASAPGVKEMGDVLHTATQSFRAAAADRSGGDPFRLLNSFYSWAHLFVVVQDVEQVAPGVYEYDWTDHRLLRASGPVTEDDVLGCIQGQRGVLGTGFVVFVVADLRRYAWLYRHSRAYLHLLIQVGELGQELLMAAGELGLGGWPSPAIHESRSAVLLSLPEDDALEVLAMIKLGRPFRRRRFDPHPTAAG